jgi:ClpP class serine protease
MRSISIQVMFVFVLHRCTMLMGFHSRIHKAPKIRLSSGSLRSSVIDSVPAIAADIVPRNGIIDYIGKTSASDAEAVTGFGDLVDSPLDVYKPPSSLDLLLTRFALWRQLPWKKISGKIILSAKLGGDIRLASSPQNFFSTPDPESVSSLEDIDNFFKYAAYDPRVHAVLLDINPLQCGYAKLKEIRRRIDFFKKSGKPVVAYCATGSEKEFYLSLSCDEVYVPPEGGFDLRGFSASATFTRGVLDKIGIEPQVERIGKYKSFGDQLNRYNISEAQREVVSSLLMEASNSWVKAVSSRFNMSEQEILKIWASETRVTTRDLRRLGLVSGLLYQDQVIDKTKERFRSFSKLTKFLMSMKNISDSDLARDFPDFELDDYFKRNPRRRVVVDSGSAEATDNNETTIASAEKSDDDDDDSREKEIRKIREKAILPSLFPVGKYLKKMRKGDRILKGLPFKKVRAGPRIAIINAVGGINTGKSNAGNNPSIGSDTLIEMVRDCRKDKNILGVVIRVDSPGKTCTYP